MTEPQPIDAPRPNRSTGPKTPEGKRACAQSSFPLFDQSIDDDRWRLKRARTIESGMFAIGMQRGADQARAGYKRGHSPGRPYQPEAYSPTAPPVRESVFSTPEVTRELTRQIHLDEATRHWVCSPKLTREQVAKSAGSGPPANSHRPPASLTPLRGAC